LDDVHHAFSDAMRLALVTLLSLQTSQLPEKNFSLVPGPCSHPAVRSHQCLQDSGTSAFKAGRIALTQASKRSLGPLYPIFLILQLPYANRSANRMTLIHSNTALVDWLINFLCKLFAICHEIVTLSSICP